MTLWRRQAAATTAVLSVLLLLAGCPAKIEDRQMGESIEMGAFVFEIEGTTEEYFRSNKTIVVHFWLDRDKSGPFRKPFSETLFGNMSIVDGAGNKFSASSMGPVSGNQLSSTEWRVTFLIHSDAPGVRDKDHLGDRPSDFHLFIGNSDRRGDQPRKVSIALR
jgi:hypothetical protein